MKNLKVVRRLLSMSANPNIANIVSHWLTQYKCVYGQSVLQGLKNPFSFAKHHFLHIFLHSAECNVFELSSPSSDTFED